MIAKRHIPSEKRDASASLFLSTAGFTLVEILIVLALIAMIIGMTLNAIPSFSDTERMRNDAARLTNTIRFAYLQAAAEGLYYRVAIDMTERKYAVEYSDVPFYVVREGDEKEALRLRKEKEKRESESLFADVDADGSEETEESEDAAESDSESQVVNPSSFAALEDDVLEPRTLEDGVRLHSFYAIHHKEPVKEGTVYLYFFPRGQTEFAIITLTTAPEDVDAESEDEPALSLIVNPLTGAVEIREGYADPEEVKEEMTKA